MEKDNSEKESEKMRTLTEEELLAEVKGLLGYLRDNLPEKVSREEVSMLSKSALKAHFIRASLLHRAAELVDTALDMYEQKRVVSGLVIVRAAFETAALLYYVCKKLRTTVESGAVDSIDDDLMRVMFGERRNGSEISAFNILTTIDHLDKETQIDGKGQVRSLYDDLCEYAHPNWSGVMSSYARADEHSFSAVFDQEPKELVPHELILAPLNVVLIVIQEFNEEMNETLPAFTKLHEKHWKEQGGNGTQSGT